MRDYSRVSPQFWTGKTGKKLRAAGPEAVIVALYLMTSPHANMLGLYYMPLPFIAYETGLGMEGASKGLQRAIEADFCRYDEGTEVVWVCEMASYQVADALKPNDNRVAGLQRDYDSLPPNPFLEAFFSRYSKAFHMSRPRCNSGEEGCALGEGLPSPFEAPPKPGTGTGTGTGYSAPYGAGSAVPAPPPPPPEPTPQPEPEPQPEAPPQPEPQTDRDRLYALGVPLLTAAGVKEQHVRSMLGSLARDCGERAVVEALERCAHERPVAPVGWLQAALKPKRRGAGRHDLAGQDYTEGIDAEGRILG